MPIKKTAGFVRSAGPRRATKKDLIERFDQLMRNNKGGIVDFPLRYIEDHKLEESLGPLRQKCCGVISDEELVRGAKLAKVGHLLDTGREVPIPLTKADKDALKIQRSGKFWNEPKELLLTLFACSLASLTQGWDQAASGNLLWPQAFGLSIYSQHPTTKDMWIFAGVQSIPWFSAAVLGSYLSDPISEYIGRRGALFFAATCSFTSMLAASQVNSWQSMFVCRIVLGIGIGGKASVVPILESEITPTSKRGRLLVGWQVFVATGLCCGYVASYILRDSWRHQVLSGTIPAFALLVATWSSCESPRWQIIQGQYRKAFTTLVRLRKERILAAKELCSIYYQIQAERWLFSGAKFKDAEADTNPFSPELPRTSYRRRLINHFTFPRIRRAALAAMIVMLSQQFSGINVIAFLSTNFFSTAGLRPSSPAQAELDSYKLAIGWAAVNSIASVWAYFLVENKEEVSDTATEVESEIDEEEDYDEKADFQQRDNPDEDDSSDIPNVLSNEDPEMPAEIAKRLSSISQRVTFQEDFNKLDDGHYQYAKTPKLPDRNDGYLDEPSQASPRSSRASSIVSAPDDGEYDEATRGDSTSEVLDPKGKFQFRGRRFLLLVSLAGGAVTLLATSLCFMIPEGNGARLPMIAIFIMVFTVFYSIGAGAVAFLYCAEIFPNEGREIGMSWSTFWNFFGVGILLLFVPFGINYSHGKLLGIFSGLNVFAFILVWFFVPSTNQTATLEDMSYIFGLRTRDHVMAQLRRLNPRHSAKVPVFEFKTAQLGRASVSTVEVGNRSRDNAGEIAGEVSLNEASPDHANEKSSAGVQAHVRSIKTTAKGKEPDRIESIAKKSA